MNSIRNTTVGIIVFLITLAGIASHSIAASDDAVTVPIGKDRLIVRVCEPDIVRFDYQKNGQSDPETPVLDPDQKWAQAPHVHVKNDDGATVIDTPKLSVIITEAGLVIIKAGGRELFRESSESVDSSNAEGSSLHFAIDGSARFYGVKAYDIAGSYKEPGAKTLLREGTFQACALTQGGGGSPFIWTTSGFGLVIDSDNGFFTKSNNRLIFAYGKPSAQTNGRLYEKKNSFTWFVIAGNPHEIFAGLSQITGHAPMFPKWAVGFTNSQWGITQDMAITAIDHYRAGGIPIDNFTFDFDWKAWGDDHFGEFRWNKEKFPSANATSEESFAAKMAVRQIKITGIMKPRIVRFTDPDGKGPETAQGKEADDRHFWLPGLDRHTDYMSRLPCGELDFSIPACRAWFWENVKKWGAMQNGIAGFWNDEADEADLGNRHHVVFNNFEHMRMEQALYEGQRAWTENGHNVTRAWSLNRNFYLGAQRYAYGTWSGDISTGFESMALQPARMLSAISLGQMRWSMDTGGFHGTPSPENYARWMQFAAFVPIFRVHGTHLEHRQPWVYGEKAEEAAANAIRLRYRLAPYIYAYDRELYESGIGLVRPLMMEFPNDPHSADVTDEWMFGDSLLAAPVLKEHAADRLIYLPPGDWIDYFRGDVLHGGQRIAYSINQNNWMDIPLFIRVGAIIPTQDVVPSIGAAKPKQIDLDLFPDDQTHAATIYDDDGESYDCEKSGFFKQSVIAKPNTDGVSLAIAARQGNYQPSFRYYLVKIHGTAAMSATLDGQPFTEVSNPSQLVDVPGKWMRGKDVYGEFTLICLPAAKTNEIHLELHGKHPVTNDVETIEAEDGTLAGETVDTVPTVSQDHPGYSGIGFVSGFNHPSDALTLSVKRHAQGTYLAHIRFADDNRPETLSLFVNGEQTSTIKFPATADWGNWRDVAVDLPLAAGNNVIGLRREPEDTGDVNVDCVKIAWQAK